MRAKVIVETKDIICGGRDKLSLRCDTLCLIESSNRSCRGLTSSILWVPFLTALIPVCLLCHFGVDYGGVWYHTWFQAPKRTVSRQKCS